MSLESVIRDPRSGIRKKPIPDPGSRGQKGTGSRILDPGSRIWIRNTGYDNKFFFTPVLSLLFLDPGSEIRDG